MAGMALLHVSNFVYKKFSQLSTKHNSLATKITYQFRSEDMNLFLLAKNNIKAAISRKKINAYIYFKPKYLIRFVIE